MSNVTIITPLLNSEGLCPGSQRDLNPNLLKPSPVLSCVPHVASPNKKVPGTSESKKAQGGKETTKSNVLGDIGVAPYFIFVLGEGQRSGLELQLLLLRTYRQVETQPRQPGVYDYSGG